MYIDNFFINVDLYIALKEIGIGAIGTIKAGSFSIKLLAFSGPSNKIKI